MSNKKIVVQITNAESSSEETETFTVYYIEFFFQNHMWKVVHRYSTLLEIHNLLKKLFPNSKFPKFPKKKLWGSMNPEVVMKRITKLQNYLQFVVDNEEMCIVPEVKTKLELENNYFKILRQKPIPDDVDLNTVSPLVKSLVTYILDNGLTTEYIFYKKPTLSILQSLTDALIRDGEYYDLVKNNADVLAVAIILKQHLENFPLPLMTPFIQYMALDDIVSPDQKLTQARTLLNSLPAPRRHLAHFILFLVSEVSENSDTNRMDAKKLLPIFTPIFFKPLEGELTQLELAKLQKVLKFLLENHNELFKQKN